MTCIAAVVDARGVCMGGDTLIVGEDWSRVASNVRKVQRVGDLLVGFAGSLASCQRFLLWLRANHARIEPKMLDSGEVGMMYRRHLLKESPAMDVDERPLDGSILMACAGRLFLLDSALGVTAIRHHYYASGSGDAYALGALAVLKGLPRTRVRKALGAAALHNVGVGPPWTILSTKRQARRLAA
ncbi:MAG: hypothetical protein VW405_00235 [Rhodospirillaceae bacterium]